jgi:hypothetical protein
MMTYYSAGYRHARRLLLGGIILSRSTKRCMCGLKLRRRDGRYVHERFEDAMMCRGWAALHASPSSRHPTPGSEVLAWR